MNREINYKWAIFHSHVSLPDGKQEIFVDTSNLMIYKNVGIELGYTGRKLGDVASIYGSEYGYHIGLVWLNQQLSMMGVLQINNQTNRGM